MRWRQDIYMFSVVCVASLIDSNGTTNVTSVWPNWTSCIANTWFEKLHFALPWYPFCQCLLNFFRLNNACTDRMIWKMWHFIHYWLWKKLALYSLMALKKQSFVHLRYSAWFQTDTYNKIQWWLTKLVRTWTLGDTSQRSWTDHPMKSNRAELMSVDRHDLAARLGRFSTYLE